MAPIKMWRPESDREVDPRAGIVVLRRPVRYGTFMASRFLQTSLGEVRISPLLQYVFETISCLVEVVLSLFQTKLW